jgi:hypothetical protein
MTTANAANEDWKLLLLFFPPNWKELGQETEALKGLRQDKSEENYMRTLLLHLGCGFSMRETADRPSLRNFPTWPCSSGCAKAKIGCIGFVARSLRNAVLLPNRRLFQRYD